jgi:purine-binding chemotaxis protein CheW
MSEKARQIHEQTLTQPDSALANYLDTLLAEIDNQDDSTPQQAVKEPFAKVDTVPESSVTDEVALDVIERTEEIERKTADSHPPEWAQTPFQILRFRVNGINLVVPLLSLTGIITLDRPITQLPGQPLWSRGVVTNHETKVVVVDSRRLLMLEGEIEETSYTHLLLIGEGAWGLAVEGLGDTTIIDKEAVRWRSDEVPHPWYAGILVEELSVLLDVEGVLEMLAE